MEVGGERSAARASALIPEVQHDVPLRVQRLGLHEHSVARLVGLDAPVTARVLLVHRGAEEGRVELPGLQGADPVGERSGGASVAARVAVPGDVLEVVLDARDVADRAEAEEGRLGLGITDVPGPGEYQAACFP